MNRELLERARAAYRARFAWIDGHADTWTVLRDAESLSVVVDALAELVTGAGANLVLGIEARGFLLGPAVAQAAGKGFVAIRKGDGLFAGGTESAETAPDYRGVRHRFRLRGQDVNAGDVVVLVDDWIETGSQASTARLLVEGRGAQWAGSVVIVDQSDDGTRSAVGPIHALMRASDLPVA